MTTLANGGAAVRHALVVADGDVPSRDALDEAWPGWDAGVTDVLAADGGYARALAVGLRPTLLVGDLDSLEPALVTRAEEEGTPIRRAQAAKDESDAELALLAALEAGATRVTMLGAFGGPRLDHALANVWLLAHPSAASASVVLLDERTRVSLLTAPGRDGLPVARELPGRPAAIVSLLPFAGDAEGITTSGLRYALVNEPLRVGPARGLSNVREATGASVTLSKGRLIIVEAAS